MYFTSVEFYFYLCFVAGIYYLIPSSGYRSLYLLFVSYLFYWIVTSYAYVLLLLGTTLFVYLLGQILTKPFSDTIRGTLLWIGIFPILGILLLFKLNVSSPGWVLPLGISYTAFKLLAYLIEIYWDESEPQLGLIDFSLYIAFFPQIISGPIQRPAHFLKTVTLVKNGTVDSGQIELGYRLILGGLLLKVLVGDRLAAFLHIVDTDPMLYRRGVTRVATLCTTLQLYCDFAGYTNIAIGIGKIFGFDAPQNFNAPFSAATLPDMWRRWHMSLTSWLQDYLFNPLLFTLRGWGVLGLIVALTLNMVIIGLWHGVTVNFAIFGLFHAIFILATYFSRPLITRSYRFFDDISVHLNVTKLNRNPFILQRSGHQLWRYFLTIGGVLLTFLLMSLSMIFWSSPTLDAALIRLSIVLGITKPGLLTLDDVSGEVVHPVFICMLIAFYFGSGAPGIGCVRYYCDRLLPHWFQYGIALFMLSCLDPKSDTPFIYGHF